jgi:hypothetical protein
MYHSTHASAKTMALLAQLPRAPSHLPAPRQLTAEKNLSRRLRALKAGLYQHHVPKIPPPNDTVAHEIVSFMQKRGPAASGNKYGFLHSTYTHVPKPREPYSNHTRHPNYHFMKKTGQKYATIHRASQLHAALPRPTNRHALARHDAIGKQLFDAVKLHDTHHTWARERWANHQRYFSLIGNHSYHH